LVICKFAICQHALFTSHRFGKYRNCAKYGYLPNAAPDNFRLILGILAKLDMKMLQLKPNYFSSFSLTGLFLVFVLLFGLPAYAGSLVSQSSSGIAIKGYDPVAYFTENKAIKGSDEFTHRWLGATWNFASAEHMEMFIADPINYLPQYGGYCAASMAGGAIYEADPEAWRIVDGMLYLNYSTWVMTKWAKDIPGNISVANEKWVQVKSKLTQ
jgi:hypothetical protein